MFQALKATKTLAMLSVLSWKIILSFTFYIFIESLLVHLPFSPLIDGLTVLQISFTTINDSRTQVVTS